MKQLKNISTKAPNSFNKNKTKKKTKELKKKIGELQNLLFAEGKYALLVVLQGMDASGKDGAIKNVFNNVNPMGCSVISFKKPTEIEMEHDFLWRVHASVPRKGMIHIFNRSHYEDVLIQRVHKWVDEKTINDRYEHINNFERLLEDTNTKVLKFYLHVSQKEQISRLEERLHDEKKKWKYNENDIKESQLWNDYMESYQGAFDNCSKHSDWNIVPSDQNWYKEYLIAKKIVETLEGFKMKYPGFK
jgi:PPK2 family polyphosphate:nucleotide phosphotransferase